MEFSARQIADLLEGTVEGDENIKVSTLSRIEEGVPGSLSFLANPLYTPHLYSTKASVIIVGKEFHTSQSVNGTLIRVKDPYSSFARLLELYNQIKHNKTGISERASISSSASIGKDVYIGDFVTVGNHTRIADGVKIYPSAYIGNNVTIGGQTLIFAGAKVFDDCLIGENCTIHAGVVVGGDGFGFSPNDENNYRKVAQIGNVIIEDNVEVGNNTTIDRATLGSTIIRKGVKLDNLIQIAHNVEIGENTVIAAQTGISGSTKIGKNCMIGGQVGIIGHITIADGVKIAAQSGIGASIQEAGVVLQGSPAFEIGPYRKAYVHFRRLDELVKRVLKLESKMNV